MLTQDDIIYFIVTDRFADGDKENNGSVDTGNPRAYHGGDFAGIVDRIPYLQHLGITALWITPVFQNIHLPEYGVWGYHGYWPLDFEKVDPHLYSPKPGIPEGSKRYLKDLVDQLHAAGIKVILDIVVNHTGYNHPGLNNDPSTPIQRHWFNDPRPLEETGDIGGWLAGLPDLKQDEPEVADYFVNVIADWIGETGVDCIRMDTAKHVEGLFWHYYKTVVKSKYPTASLLGEVLEFDIDKVSAFQRHFAFDSLFDFPLQHAVEDVFIHGKPFSHITSPFSTLMKPGTGVLDRDTAYTNHNRLVTLLDNHDLSARFLTTALEQSGGNRPWAIRTLQLALTFLLTSRGTPQIYYGTELALEGGGDPDNRRDMPWNLLPNGLEPDPEFSEASEVYNHLRSLILLRRHNEAFRYGDQLGLYVDDRILVYLRCYRNHWAIVAINLADEEMAEPLIINVSNNQELPPHLRTRIANQQYIDTQRLLPSGRLTNGNLHLKLPGHSASILLPFADTLTFLVND